MLQGINQLLTGRCWGEIFLMDKRFGDCVLLAFLHLLLNFHKVIAVVRDWITGLIWDSDYLRLQVKSDSAPISGKYCLPHLITVLC